VETKGNRDCHVILRGGKAPNYDAASVAAACAELDKAKLPTSLMVDFSHANSSKQHEKQVDVARDIATQISGGSRSVFGVMVESHIQAGAQKFSPGKDDPTQLEYGRSITDACIGWDDSQRVLDILSEAVRKRRG
jgi:3-deoxy-7-phosphoheptulonate synthase